MILTRYLGSHLEDILMKSRLKVSKISDLNDPFELRCRFVGEMTRESAETSLLRRIKSGGYAYQQIIKDDRFRGKSYSEIIHSLEKNMANITDYYLDKMPDVRKEIIDNNIVLADKMFRVICFSNSTQKKSEEILLWSHYTKGHSGFRIWINLSLEKLLLNTTRDVIYRDDLLSIDINDPNLEQNAAPVFMEATYTKAKCWEYEDEVRVFIPKESCKLEEGEEEPLEYINISLESLIRIDFGIKFPIEKRDSLIKELKRKGLSNIELFQCGINYDEYALEYEQV